MDDPNITMEEYIRLEEEKARKHAIAFNDEVSPETLSCEPTEVPLTMKLTVEFRLTISTMRTTRCFDDLDFFKDFENEFPAIVYNDAQTSKSDLLTELNFNPQHIDEFDLNDETSLSEYKEEEQNVLYFNDLFPFNIIHSDVLKSEKDNDDNDIDIILSSEGDEITHGSKMFSKTSYDKITKTFRTGSFVMNLKVRIVIWNYYGMLFYLVVNLYVPFGIPFDPKRYYKDGVYTRMLRRPRYEKLQYTDADIVDFELMLARIYQREVHKVHVFDFKGLPDLMAKRLSAKMLIEHRDAQLCTKPLTPYPSRKDTEYPALHSPKDHEGHKTKYAVSEEINSSIEAFRKVNILEDIKRGPYSKKLQYVVSNTLDTPY
ncbi:hypothetical protein Tco_1281862 [Tanacetum coccineum]